MIKINELKGEIIKAGYTQTSLAREIGISPKSFYSKMKKGIFNSNEIDAMIGLLKIQDPVSIFFAKKVS